MIVAENVAMATSVAIATGPLNLQFMIEYIKNSMEYKLQNRNMYSV